ncbi:MAG: thioredoxin-dependent thiol peroxidase [Bacteroidia bacterium]|jgi:peroxiredoxin Q/BCP|nr:thioredoxin-dependent thiol peroxidase [Bacteroidia bacterium]
MTHLKAGDPAPDFTSSDQDGNSVSLKDFSGKKLVIYFYPRDNTPGCTAQACNLRDNYQALLTAGYEVLGVSPDSEKSHRGFKEKFKLPFRLLADPERVMAKAFDVYHPKKFMGREFMGIHRTTFVIDEKGVIESVISKVETKQHATQIL